MTKTQIEQSRLDAVLASHLKSGNHDEAEKQMCVMEAAAYIANEPWSDSPKCVCPVIRSFLISWNDSLPTDEDRDRLLKPLLPKIIGTVSTKDVEERRSYMALDWLVRVQAPKFLELNSSLVVHAKALRGLDEIVDMAGATAASIPVRAAWAAAWAAAGAAAGDAARAAAGDAAWAAAGAAAGDAARAAAWAAARAAARAKLSPTVDWLQKSASDLVIRMCEVGSET